MLSICSHITKRSKEFDKKGRIAAAHGRFSGIRHVAPLRTPPKARFLRPTKVENPNGISIGSAVLGDRFALCYRTVVLTCLSCLSVTLACCGQMVRWIKMKFGMEVGVGPRHILLDGDPASPPKKGHSSPHFSVHALWPNGRMDQYDTW